MIKEKYIIAKTTIYGIRLATRKRFNHEFEVKDWIEANGKSNVGYMIIKEYVK